MRRRLRVLACALGLALTGATAAHADNAQFVDPFIGTAAREQPYAKGNTFPGALVPNGMVAISPDTSPRYPGGYRHGAPYIEGFSQNHMSGVGCTGDLGNILLMPTVGAIRAALRGYRSAYHDETAEAGYYKVRLAKGGIVAEMSATRRASISRYTFPARNGDANILIDVSHGLSPSTGGSVRVVSANEVEGFNEAGEFCRGPNPYRLHFVARFSKPAAATGTWTATWFGAATSPASQRVGNDIGAYLRFTTAAGEAIEVRLGVSYVSIANARANLDAEIPQGRTFAQVRANAFAEWDEDLGRIRVTGGTPAQRTMFYTALYHALIHPGINSDVNGQYQGMGGAGVRNGPLFHYHIFSLWDTYRSLHPLLTLAYPERQQQMVRSMVTMFKESGWLPKWEMVSRERYTMVGDPAGIVIADSYLKGVRGFDVDAAYTAMRKSAATRSGNPLRPCIGLYLDLGYIPHDTCTKKGSVSVTQEYAYADHALARLAAALGKTADAELFGRRALAHRDLFDAQTGFLRPRNADGSWAAPFEPLCCGLGNGKFEGPGYIEGTAWQYLFMVPHDIDGLKSLLGGDLAFRRKLDTAFTERTGLLHADQRADDALSLPLHLRAGRSLAHPGAGARGHQPLFRHEPGRAARQRRRRPDLEPAPVRHDGLLSGGPAQRRLPDRQPRLHLGDN